MVVGWLNDFVIIIIYCLIVVSSVVVKGLDVDIVCEGNIGFCSVFSYFLYLCFFYLIF